MKSIVYFLAALVFLGCASTTKTHTITEKDTKALDELVTSKSFEIASDWAQPQVTNALTQIGNAGLFPPGSNVGNISLIGNSNYLKMQGEKVQAYLPYFGERQMGGTYSNNRSGIEFDGTPEDLEVKRGKRDSYEIRFNIKDKNSTENYAVTILLFPNLSSSININSSYRFPIRYKGYAKTISNDEEKI